MRRQTTQISARAYSSWPLSKSPKPFRSPTRSVQLHFPSSSSDPLLILKPSPRCGWVWGNGGFESSGNVWKCYWFGFFQRHRFGFSFLKQPAALGFGLVARLVCFWLSGWPVLLVAFVSAAPGAFGACVPLCSRRPPLLLRLGVGVPVCSVVPHLGLFWGGVVGPW